MRRRCPPFIVGLLAFIYGVFAYLLFLASSLYAIGFVGNMLVPKSIDSGARSSLGEALLVNTFLIALFGVQHSVMARAGFKRWWTRLVPPAIERSTYVLFSSLLLFSLFWQWRPLTERIWFVDHVVAAGVLHAAFWMGWGLLVVSTFLLSHWELLGLAQVLARFRGREPAASPAIGTDTKSELRTPSLYRWVRHPIYFSFLLAFWATPDMTAGHLLFALGMTLYVLIGIWFEERDLVRHFGDAYRRYREQVPALVPVPWRSRRDSETRAHSKCKSSRGL